MRAVATENGRGTGTQTLERGLDLLELVAREPMRSADLVERSGLSRSTAKRLLQCLTERGFLTAGARGQLRAGPTLLQLGACAQSSSDLLTIARPHLEALSGRTGISSFLGRREGDFSVHVHRTPGTHRVTVGTPVGTRRRLAETSLGKALLLDDDFESWRRLFEAADSTRLASNWAAQMRGSVAAGVVQHEGPPPDCIRAVAAPVRDASNTIMAAISVATVDQYLNALGMAELAPCVREAAEAISRELGWRESGLLS